MVPGSRLAYTMSRYSLVGLQYSEELGTGSGRRGRMHEGGNW